LPVFVYRPGVITGDSRYGTCNPDDALSLMFRACFRLRAAPESGDCVHLTPVDYVSQAIAEVSRQPCCAGKAFHLVNPRYLTWRQISETMIDSGYIDRTLPYGEWLACLREHAAMHADARLSVLGGLLRDLVRDEPPRSYDDINTRTALAGTPHVRCPENDIALLTRQLEWLRALD
jgi:thioester reductase-like protein